MTLQARLLRRWVRPRIPAARLEPARDLGPPPAAGGTLAVLLHGTFCDAGSMRALGRTLAELGHPVWCPEHPYLESMAVTGRRVGELVQQRLDGLGPDAPRRLMLLGYSQGALMAERLLTSRDPPPWARRVQALLQLAPPRRGIPLVRPAAGLATPALGELVPGSDYLRRLARRPWPPGLSRGVVVGRARADEVLGHFLGERLVGRVAARSLGLLLELLYLGGGPHDGVVPEESARAPARGGAPAHVEVVAAGHIRLLCAPGALRAVARLARALGPAPLRSPEGSGPPPPLAQS